MKSLKTIIKILIILLLVLVIYSFRLELLGFRVCESPDLLDINEVSQESDGANYTVNISGDTMSSALFFKKYKYKLENKIILALYKGR